MELRLNTIDPDKWKVKFNNFALNIIHFHRGVEKKYIINNDFLNSPETKSLNELRKPLMENFGLLKNGSAGILKNGELDAKLMDQLILSKKLLILVNKDFKLIDIKV